MHRAPNHTYAGHFNALNCFPSFRSLSTTRNQNRYREKEGAAGVLFATGKPFMCSTRPRLQTSMETYNISDRPPRKITLGEIGFPDPNLMAHVNLSKPLMGTLGPIVASFLSFLMGRGFTKGTPYRIHDVMIPLKGPKVGIKSAVDLYFPRKVYDKRLKCPTIIIRTPYWKDMTQVIGQYLAQNGYVVVFQDIRGTGHSEGYNSFLFLERDDALSIMEWLKKAFWYNGRISTWGASYLGMTQYVIWDNEDMTCFNVQISSPRNIWSIHQGLFPNELGAHIARIFCKGKFRDQPPEATQAREHFWQYTGQHLTDPAVSFTNKPIGIEKIHLRDFEKMSTRDITGMINGVFGVDLRAKDPDHDKYYRFMMDIFYGHTIDNYHEYMPGMLKVDPTKYQRPVLLSAGWYDMFAPVMIKDFCDIMAHGSEMARKYTKMAVGPWVHGAVRHPEVKNLYNGGIGDMIKHFMNVDWYNYWLKDGDEHDGASEFETCTTRDEIKKRLLDTPPLKIFTICKNEWRYEQGWPVANTTYKNAYFHSSGRANSRKGDGTLSFVAPTSDEQPDSYRHDPANPVISKGGPNLHIPNGAFEQSSVESREDVLVYTGEALKDGIEVTGDITMVLHAATTAIDTDFIVRLCDVYPNGKSYNVSDLGIRARYRDGILKLPSYVEPGRVYAYTIPMWPTSYFFQPGHRMRIVIASSDFPRYAVHPNLANGNKDEYAIAKQVVYHDKARPSHVILPVIP